MGKLVIMVVRTYRKLGQLFLSISLQGHFEFVTFIYYLFNNILLNFTPLLIFAITIMLGNRHFLTKSEVEPKPIVIACFPVLDACHLYFRVLIGSLCCLRQSNSNYFGFGFMTLTVKALLITPPPPRGLFNYRP